MPDPHYRVGILLDSLVGGGAERMALNFAESLRALGHDAHVFLVANTIEHDTGEVPVHVLSHDGQLVNWRPMNKLLLARRLQKEIAAIASDGKPFDFFISNAEDMDRLSRIARLPCVLIRYRNSLMQYLSDKLGQSRGLKRHIRRVRWLRKFRSIYDGRHIVAISSAMARELTEDVGIRPASLNTIYNPFNFARLQRLAEEAADDLPTSPYIICAARLSARKDQETLIRAYAAAGISEDLVLLGGTTSPQEAAYELRLRRLIDELGLANRVHLPGFRANPYPWIRHARLFVLSSRSEGLPLSLVESLVIGTPAISTDCPTGPSEVLLGRLRRFLSPVGDVATLAENIRQALIAYPGSDDAHLERFRDDFAIGEYLHLFERLTGRSSLSRT